MKTTDTIQGQMLKRDLRQAINDWGYPATIDVLAEIAQEHRDEADKEGDESGRSAYGNLRHGLVRLSNEFAL